MRKATLQHAVHILFFFVLVFAVLYVGKPVLIPVAIAAMLAMLFMPFAAWMERKGIGRGVAAFFCVLSFVLIIGGIGLLLSWQISEIASDFSNIEKDISHRVSKLQQYLNNVFGVSPERQQQIIEEQSKSAGGSSGKVVGAIMGSILGLFTNTVLVLVYIFLFLYFRSHLKNFILKLVPEKEKAKTTQIVGRSGKVAQQYLGGLAMMIVILWVMYGIGFSIAGIRYALFFAILCGLLEIVPFIGNLLGTTFTMLFTLAQGDSGGMVAGVLITYALVQFIQTYILEPLVVGAEVNINPLFTIFVLVVGETVWGVPGMVLAIPLLGIVKIICDHIEPLKPYGYLIGSNDKKPGEGTGEKIKKLFGKKV